MYILAEVGLAHDGSLAHALAYADAVARVNAASPIQVDGLKFQLHSARHESSNVERFRVRNYSPSYSTRHEYWQHTSFTKEEWYFLARYCKMRGLDFVCSPFSEWAADFLLDFNMPLWKVASGEIYTFPYRVAKDKPVVISTGLVDVEDADALEKLYVHAMEGDPSEVIFAACDTLYPSGYRTFNTAVALEGSLPGGAKMGLSDHSGNPLVPALTHFFLPYAIEFIEVHIKLFDSDFLYDNSASLSMDDLAVMLRTIHTGEAMHNTSLRETMKARKANTLFMQKLFFKSATATRPIKQGELLDKTNLALRKPGSGLDLASCIGMIASRDIPKGAQLVADDLTTDKLPIPYEE